MFYYLYGFLKQSSPMLKLLVQYFAVCRKMSLRKYRLVNNDIACNVLHETFYDRDQGKRVQPFDKHIVRIAD